MEAERLSADCALIRRAMGRHLPQPLAMAIFMLVIFAASAGLVLAQDSERSTNLSLPTDRTLGAKFTQLKTMVENGQFNEVTQFLGNLLGGEPNAIEAEDSFFFDEKKPQFPQGLKDEARRILGALPEKGRAAYELQFGARAEKMLEAAIDSGNLDQLAEVSRRYFHTLAGYQATFLIGMHDLDHGHPLAAAHMFEMLLQSATARKLLDPALSLRAATSWLWAGKPERAREILVAWKRSSGGKPLARGDNSVALFSSDAEAVIWLSQLVGEPVLAGASPGESWTMHRGDAGRNGQMQGGAPLFSTRWRVRVANDPSIERLIKGLEELSRQKNVALIPAMHPLAVGNVVLTRSVRDVIAIDFQSGKRLWEVRPQVDDGFDRLIKAGHISRREGDQRSQLIEQLGRRMWDDTLYGTMSTDGERLFVVQDLSIELGESYGQGIFFGGGQAPIEDDRTKNRLSALAIHSGGAALWSVGGEESEEESLVGAFFLGAPLPLEGKLYALAEIRGGIRLIALEAESGKLLWSQQLGDVELNIGQHSQRRLSGASPSYGNGVLVCPIGSGAVVAVDVSSRALKWAYRYPEKETGYGRGMFRSSFSSTSLDRENDQWIDNTVTIVGEKVILTPVESNRLYCLNLFDGSPVWEAKRRGDNLYVACAHLGKVILVGTEHLTAIDLADGGQGWPDGMLSLAGGQVPSGRGYYSGNHYYLPLASAEVAKIDLIDGKIVSTAKSRDGHVPGNLICHDGMVLSQGADHLYKYFQLEPLQSWVDQTLLKNPQDAVALLRKGQLKLEQGEAGAALDLLREANHQSIAHELPAATQFEIREMLSRCLMEGLRIDFPTHRAALAELRSILDQPDQQTALLRLEASGLQRAGESIAAFNTYLQLMNLADTPDTALESIGPGHEARRERWIAAQLAELHATADAATRQRMESVANSQLDRLNDASSLSEIQTAYRCFSFHPRRAEIAMLLCDRLLTAQQSLEAALLLESYRGSELLERRGPAVARLARLLREAGQFAESSALYRELETSLANTVCLAGKTGKQVVESLSAEEKASLLKADKGHAAWPLGEVRANLRSGGGEMLFRNSRYLPLRGSRGDFFRETQLALDQQPLGVVGFDGQGAVRFRIPLQPPGEQHHDYDVDPSTSFAVGNGRLLLVSMGNEIIALDTLHTRSAGWQNVLWKLNLSEFAGGLNAASRFMHLKPVRVPGGQFRFRAEDGNGNPVGNIGPVGFDTVILQRQDALLAVHALTGEILWVRREAPLGCELFGDEELLFAVAPNSTEAKIYRAADGAELGTTAVASESKRVATLGRKILTFSRTGGQFTLALVDPFAKQTLWSETLERNTQVWNVQDELVGAMEPSGRFRLFHMQDGTTAVDQQLEPEERLDGILVFADKHQYTLIAHHVEPFPNPEDTVMPVPGEPSDPPLMSGRIYAFNKQTGQPLWQVPATIQHRGMHSMRYPDLPVLVFVQNVLRADSERGNTTVLCLDKRTGQAIYRNNAIRYTPRANFDYRVEGSAAAGTITLSLPTTTITLTLTDESRPPEPPEQEATRGGAQQRSQRVMGIFDSTIKALGTKSEDRADDADLFPPEIEEKKK